jgi:ribosome-binding factor A
LDAHFADHDHALKPRILQLAGKHGVQFVGSEVRVQPDMRHARAFIYVRGTDKEKDDAIKALQHAAGFIRREMVERLQLRRTPELRFTLDLSQEYSERIEQLLKDVKKDKPAAP